MHCSRKVKLIILIFMSLSVYIIYNATNHHNINYTTIGDSLSYGKDCYGQIDYGYSDYVRDYLQETNKLKNYCKDYTKEEMTIDSLYNTLLSEQKMSNKNTNQTLKTILRDSDYLTMSIGLNDLLYKLSLTSNFTTENLNLIIAEISTSFDNLITEIRKVYNREIYVVGYYDLTTDNKFLNTAVTKLNNIYKSHPDVIYISTKELTENPNVFLPNPNSYYPNYKGYQLISNKIITKMTKKLEK